MVADYLLQLFGLVGKKAVVMGATGVLGGRMAEVLAKAGASVTVAGRDADRGEARVQSIVAAGGQAFYLPVDAQSRESIEELCQRSEEIHGPTDILIHAAGMNSGRPYFEIADEEWQKIFEVNLRSVHQACQIFGRGMVERRSGSIINVASASSDKPLSRVFAYSASKAALVSLTKNLAREWGPVGVRVNALSPGFFPAEQNRKILDASRQQAILAHTPMGRFGSPQDLDGAVLLLASGVGGGFITGENLFVDGGFTAMSI
jgi:NAD(P)-dependent dehydrogenase (short-subunit alcohol dehydrogenase family)